MIAVGTVNILDVPVGMYTMTSLLARMEELIAAPGCAVAYYVNAHALNLTSRYPDYLEALRRADLVYADGASLLLAAAFLGGRLPEKLTTTDVWPKACEMATRRGFRFFLLGGDAGVAEQMKVRTVERYPALQIVGTHHGYFEIGDEELVPTINAVHPDILWVGMGDPKQVFWAEAVKKRLEVGLVVTCGGMFNFISGRISRAPHWLSDHGFEWLYRLVTEPRRLSQRYLLGLPTFGARVLAQRFLGHRGERTSKLSRL
ncbi:MAG TPA: WecB/TagA/CpsF family glycosyltransferase [Candidatus Binatia bacterium]|nr:WecB/TagA/CpsF family glycosyltransferase [Candidatus Binatia bacterium]